MRDDLRRNWHLPISQPYTMNPYNCNGWESIIGSMLDDKGDSSVVDRVLLALRNSSDPAIIIAQKTALIQRDGTIVSEDGSPDIAFSAQPGDYYLALRHRNHLWVMSSTPLTLNDDQPTNFDFRSDALRHKSGVKEDPALVHNGQQLLWWGDVNKDGNIRYNWSYSDSALISALILNDPWNIFWTNNYTLLQGYYEEDTNMDGWVIYVSTDIILISTNILANSKWNTSQSNTYQWLTHNLP